MKMMKTKFKDILKMCKDNNIECVDISNDLEEQRKRYIDNFDIYDFDMDRKAEEDFEEEQEE